MKEIKKITIIIIVSIIISYLTGGFLFDSFNDVVIKQIGYSLLGFIAWAVVLLFILIGLVD